MRRTSVPRHGEHAERVVVAKIELGGEGKSREVGKRPAVVGRDARGLEGAPVVRHVRVRMLQRPAKALELQVEQRVAAQALSRVEQLDRWRCAGGHAGSLSIVRLVPRNSAMTSSPRRTVTS